MEDNIRKIQLKTTVQLPEKGKKRGLQEEVVHIDILASQNVQADISNYEELLPNKKAVLESALSYLVNKEDEVFSWMEKSAENAILFVHDPVSALKQAIPDFDDQILNQLVDSA